MPCHWTQYHWQSSSTIDHIKLIGHKKIWSGLFWGLHGYIIHKKRSANGLRWKLASFTSAVLAQNPDGQHPKKPYNFIWAHWQQHLPLRIEFDFKIPKFWTATLVFTLSHLRGHDIMLKHMVLEVRTTTSQSLLHTNYTCLLTFLHCVDLMWS